MIVMSIISSKDDRMYGKIMTIKIKTIEIIDLVDIIIDITIIIFNF